MALIHCKACGRNYSYEKHGCCPACGAYNRPPRREQVYADGTVHHLKEQDRRPVPHGDKVCYERQTEQPRRKSSGAQWVQQLREGLPTGGGKMRSQQLLGLVALVMTIAVIAVCTLWDQGYVSLEQPVQEEYQLPDRSPDITLQDCNLWVGDNWSFQEPEDGTGQLRTFFAVELWLEDDTLLEDGTISVELAYCGNDGDLHFVLPSVLEQRDIGKWLLTYPIPDWNDSEWPMLYFRNEEGLLDFCYLA